jgi:membrane protease YdiL (CAAX protease family)
MRRPKPFFIGALLTLVVNIPMNFIAMLVNGKVTPHPFLTGNSALQTFLFLFIFASIAEEMLFRGFFQNSLKSLNKRGITILKCRFSLPVIISAIAFCLAHLTLISAGVDYLFLIRIVIFTFILGVTAGYYQEKYENNTSYAIIVHMGGNLFGVLSAFLFNMQQ